tara:strand:+ start:1439 stop:2470 length:1032 start_codon:yes stop_codon:yes gene_type:complete
MAQINKPGLHFNTKLYTGNGSTQSITGVGFQPDWVWVKERTSTSYHQMVDAVRGYNKRLHSNANNAEAVDSSPYNDFKSFDSDGFSLGNGGGVNENSQNYVSWNWKANGSGSANTDGSINSTVSVNTTSGFSIVSWTGSGANATIGHGLGSTPQCIIVKNRDDADNWVVYHQGLGNTDGMYLNTTDSTVGTNTFWNNTTPTTSVFSVGTHNRVNGSSDNMIAYCFADKKGFSRFGTYTGNGNVDGPFVYTGFRPAFVIQRETGNTRDWTMIDNKRSPINVMDERLVPNESTAEVTNNDTDFLSNGFKCRRDQTNTNGSNGSYIYMAWAADPLVGTNNVVGTAE